MRRFVVPVALVAVLGAGCGGDEQTAQPRPSPTDIETESPSPTPTATSTPRGNRAPNCDRGFVDCLERLARFLLEREGYAGMAAEAFRVAYLACSVFKPAEVAKEYGSASDPVSAAQAYAEDTFVPAVESAAFDGCLSAFQGKP